MRVTTDDIGCLCTKRFQKCQGTWRLPHGQVALTHPPSYHGVIRSWHTAASLRCSASKPLAPALKHSLILNVGALQIKVKMIPKFVCAGFWFILNTFHHPD